MFQILVKIQVKILVCTDPANYPAQNPVQIIGPISRANSLYNSGPAQIMVQILLKVLIQIMV